MKVTGVLTEGLSVPGQPGPPTWVGELLHRPKVARDRPHATMDRYRWVTDDFQCVAVQVHDTAAMQPLDFQQATVQAYQIIREALTSGPACPVRFWNFIPAITEPVDDTLDRYMVFNAGRYAAFAAWHGLDAVGQWSIATASGVGHRGADLLVYCLASRVPGRSLENPRQIPAYQYSPRYGPFAPSFARATWMAGRAADPPWLLIGGTASICGEQSLHLDQLRHQVEETLTNLAVLIRAGLTGADETPDQFMVRADQRDRWLAQLCSVRVYDVHAEHRALIEQMLALHLPGAVQVQWMRADLCRPELLVEIEGVAR